MADGWDGGAWVIRAHPLALLVSLGWVTIPVLGLGVLLSAILRGIGVWPGLAWLLVVPWVILVKRVLGYRIEITPEQVRFHGVVKSGVWRADEIEEFDADGMRSSGGGPCLCLNLTNGGWVTFHSVYVRSGGSGELFALRTSADVETFERMRMRIQSGELKRPRGCQ